MHVLAHPTRAAIMALLLLGALLVAAPPADATSFSQLGSPPVRVSGGLNDRHSPTR